MPIRIPPRRALLPALAIACLAGATLSACATPATDAPATPADAMPPAGQEARFDGTVASVDASPWAYDGNAVVVVRTHDGRSVRVELPARWNLCKAEAPEDLQALAAGERVRVAGTVGEDGVVVVCGQPSHHLRRAD